MDLDKLTKIADPLLTELKQLKRGTVLRFTSTKEKAEYVIMRGDDFDVMARAGLALAIDTLRGMETNQVKP